MFRNLRRSGRWAMVTSGGRLTTGLSDRERYLTSRPPPDLRGRSKGVMWLITAIA